MQNLIPTFGWSGSGDALTTHWHTWISCPNICMSLAIYTIFFPLGDASSIVFSDFGAQWYQTMSGSVYLYKMWLTDFPHVHNSWLRLYAYHKMLLKSLSRNNKSTSHLSNSSNNAAKTRPWFLWFQVLFFGWRQDSWSGFPANYYTGVVTSFVQSGTEAEKMAAKADSFHYKTDNHRNAKHNSAINQRKFPSNHAQEHKIAVKNRQYWYNRSKHHTNSKHNRAVHVLMPAFITQNLADRQKCVYLTWYSTMQRRRVTTKLQS